MKAYDKLKALYQNFFNHKNTPYTVSEKEHESMYKGGRWDYLSQLKELAHYSVIIGYLGYFTRIGAILDCGCGEGILFDRMQAFSYTRYVGIDFSQEAINRALKKQMRNSSFLKASISDYKPEEKFDAIVFNEVLYYFSPVKTLKHYEPFLKNDGVFVVSMYCSTKPFDTFKAWKDLESVYAPLDMTTVTNGYGTSWVCKVFKTSKC